MRLALASSRMDTWVAQKYGHWCGSWPTITTEWRRTMWRSALAPMVEAWRQDGWCVRSARSCRKRTQPRPASRTRRRRSPTLCTRKSIEPRKTEAAIASKMSEDSKVIIRQDGRGSGKVPYANKSAVLQSSHAATCKEGQREKGQRAPPSGEKQKKQKSKLCPMPRIN